MLFNSVTFALFLTILFVIYWSIPNKYRWTVLLVASYYFYMSWNVKYILILMFTSVVSYTAARLIYISKTSKVKNFILVIAVLMTLSVLVVFKYLNFISNSVVEVFNAFSIRIHPTTLTLVLPAGISFYTFQTIGYMADVYNGKIEPEKNIGIYALFVSFFPQIMSGPIGRADSLLPQIKKEKIFDYEKATYGMKLMAWGFFKKLCIADVLATYVDTVYGDVYAHKGIDFLLVILFYSIQIYCDFSGYTDIAIGVAKLFGYDLMINFKCPYYSKSIKEFWGRWHISLSTWFRDYLYIPLGGNRCSKVKNYRNLLITFLVSGLWHGANWTFVVWGAIHGVLQVLEKIFYQQIAAFKAKRFGRVLSVVIVFILCSIAWVFFRADNFGQAFYILSHAFAGIGIPTTFVINGIGLGGSKYITISISILLLLIYDYYDIHGGTIEKISTKPPVIRHGVYALLLLLIMLFKASGEAQFVYFNF
ncbi:D-alanyl-lipoteichoic acid acyltransferase DltB, MBOAT superfamily [Pseudobutyrivibrio sp. ACV-2]|uniref:MBOAT family O-acyltransferase n=1 Tax=Pseudobutyrivibrio sp. ACV-2 TaxID=1520801 RepID=UPI000894F1C9|nr:MBOAT family O-acyltransferase [Pseudobutyrivibrio sp. ACV-2]SEB00832.1 D-alanyl-lipoteichoic acid acyltransferase DltB, MBOAT superfamily [Pseudobutyrivibrio sp. ACV-2]